MSKFTVAATTSNTLSLAAMEEASRQGRREADLEHLFLALVLSAQPAGTVLREQGITIEGARLAVEEHHQAQLALLGITAQLPEPGRIVFHETQGYEWSKRVNDLLVRSSGKGRDGSASAVLRELLDEPSGVVSDLLDRLGVSIQSVRQALDDRAAPAPAIDRARSTDKGTVRGSSEAYIPATVDSVWAVLGDANRIPEWEPSLASIRPVSGADVQSGPWEAAVRQTDPDGKVRKIKPQFRTRFVELVSTDGSSRVSWRFSYPDSRRAPVVTLTFALVEAVGGTTVHIDSAWSRWGRGRVLAVLLRPAARFLVWISLSQVGSGISRIFR